MTIHSSQNEHIAESFLSALERGDIKEIVFLLSDGCQIWHSNDERVASKGDVIVSATHFFDMTSARSVLPVRYEDLPSGFLQQYCLSGKLDDGRDVRFDGLFIAELLNGKIVKLDEWISCGLLKAFPSA